MDTSHVAHIREITDEHQAEPNAWINSKVCCYAVYEAGDLRIGFQPLWDDQDMVWIQGLLKPAGITPVKPGAPFVGCCWHFTDDELDAIRVCMDARDLALFKDGPYPDRYIHNPPPPHVYDDAVAKLRKQNQPYQDDPQVWVPDEF